MYTQKTFRKHLELDACEWLITDVTLSARVDHKESQLDGGEYASEEIRDLNKAIIDEKPINEPLKRDEEACENYGKWKTLGVFR